MSHQWLIAVRSDLRRVVLRHRPHYPPGYGPPERLYREKGRHSVDRILARLGGGWKEGRRGRRVPRIRWIDALRRLGLRPASEINQITREEAIKDLLRVARDAGLGPNTLPPYLVYYELGNHSTHYVRRLILEGEEGGWRDIGRVLGLEPTTPTDWGSLSLEKIIRDYQELAESMGKEPGDFGPSRREFGRHVEYSTRNALLHSEGSWGEFVQLAGYEPLPSIVDSEEVRYRGSGSNEND
jgi:hypothetical protein